MVLGYFLPCQILLNIEPLDARATVASLFKKTINLFKRKYFLTKLTFLCKNLQEKRFLSEVNILNVIKQG